MDDMKANEFVKKYGLELSREIVSNQPKWASNVRVSEITGTWEYTEKVLPSFSIVELKGLVESHELVEKHQGLNGARNVLKLLEESLDIGLYHGMDGVDATTEVPKIKQAIADVEACMGEVR